MQKFLSLKIHGMKKKDEIKLLEINLKSQKGVRSLDITPLSDSVKIDLTIDEETITKKKIKLIALSMFLIDFIIFNNFNLT